MEDRRYHELTVERMSYELEDLENLEASVQREIATYEKHLAYQQTQLDSVREKKEWCYRILDESKNAIIAIDGK